MFLKSFIAFLSKIFLFTGKLERKNEFKRRLSIKEEKELASRIALARSSASSDPEAEDKLITHNLRLVAHISKKYRSMFSDSEDLISVGSIGLIKAVRSFNPEKAKNFSSYASRCIENEILMLLRYEKKYKEDISIDDKLGTDKDGNDITFADILSDPNADVTELVETNINRSKMEKIMKEILNNREIEVLSLRYGLFGNTPKTQNEVASLMSISRSYISRIEKSALEKLQNHCSKIHNSIN